MKKEKIERFTVMGVEFVYLYLMGIGFALLGWIVENCYRIVSRGIIDCRYHLMPFIWTYALIPFVYHVFLGDIDNIAPLGHRLFQCDNIRNKILSNALCLIIICASVFVGELAYGSAWEALFGVRLWNYTSMPLHVTRYTGVISSVGFGVGAYLIFRFLYRPLLNFVRAKVGYSLAKGICMSLGVVILLDSAITKIQMVVLHHAPMYWLIHLW